MMRVYLMNKFQQILLSLIIILKVTLNGVGFFGISIWFYLVGLYVLITVMYFINKRIYLDSGYRKYFLIIILMLITMFLVVGLNQKFNEKMIYLIQFLAMTVFSISVYLMIKTEKNVEKIVHT